MELNDAPGAALSPGTLVRPFEYLNVFGCLLLGRL